jgi:hypothetical protein
MLPPDSLTSGREARLIKSVPIKGLHDQTMPWEEYVGLMRASCALGIPRVSAHASQAYPGSSVGLSQQASTAGVEKNPLVWGGPCS